MAKESNIKQIAVRCGVHNTLNRRATGIRGRLGMKQVEHNAPRHFTLEFSSDKGTYQNAHGFVDVKQEQGSNGKVLQVATKVGAIGGRVTVNPEVFEEAAHSSAKAVTMNSQINRSSGTCFDLKKTPTGKPAVVKR
jgi:hypothetical protein